MPQVFLSYSRSDGAYVDQLAAYLRSGGVRIWVDRQGIGGGEQWRHQIVEAIRSAQLLVLVLSPNSARSDNVRKELDLAEASKIPILPIAIAPTEIPSGMQYQLAGVQLLELWRDPERGAEKVLKSVLRITKSDNAQLPRPPRAQPPAPLRATPVNLADLGGANLIDRLGETLGNLFRFSSRRK